MLLVPHPRAESEYLTGEVPHVLKGLGGGQASVAVESAKEGGKK